MHTPTNPHCTQTLSVRENLHRSRHKENILHIQTQLSYCCTVWDGCSVSNAQKQESLLVTKIENRPRINRNISEFCTFQQRQVSSSHSVTECAILSMRTFKIQAKSLAFFQRLNLTCLRKALHTLLLIFGVRSHLTYTSTYFFLQLQTFSIST